MQLFYGSDQIKSLLQKAKIFDNRIGTYHSFIIDGNFNFVINLSNGSILINLEELQDDERGLLNPERLTIIANRFVLSNPKLKNQEVDSLNIQIISNKQSQPQSENRNSPNKKKTILKIALFIFSILILIFLGLFKYFNGPSDKELLNNIWDKFKGNYIGFSTPLIVGTASFEVQTDGLIAVLNNQKLNKQYSYFTSNDNYQIGQKDWVTEPGTATELEFGYEGNIPFIKGKWEGNDKLTVSEFKIFPYTDGKLVAQMSTRSWRVQGTMATSKSNYEEIIKLFGKLYKDKYSKEMPNLFVSKETSDSSDASMKSSSTSNEKTSDISEEEFLEENKKKEGVITTPSGLQYKVIRMGTGSTPTLNDRITAHYVGALIDGTVFESSIERGQPATFPVSGVIPGWTEALQIMTVGSKWTLYLPSKLAYGERGAGGKIGPNTALIFDVELISIDK
ncbi:MAG: hypothetical protein RL516_7 [Bacteroidota bacterium]|jgi:FKBP-type peptidyl-prolyl cis-trans isomerase FklB